MSSHGSIWVSGLLALALATAGCGSASDRDLFATGQASVAPDGTSSAGGASGEALPGAGGVPTSGAGGVSTGVGGDAHGGGGGEEPQGPPGGAAGAGSAGSADGGSATCGADDAGAGSGGATGTDHVDAGPPCKKSPFYLDADGDGFGDPAHAVEACTAPPHHVPDHTDCYDASADAHPGQTSWFAVDRGDGSFDYDCDGVSTESDTTVGHCGTFPICSGSPGWKTSAAACGQSATWLITCTGLTTICGQTSESRIQNCR